MKQSSYRHLGLLDLLLVAALVGAFGPAALTTSVAVPGMAVAGGLSLLFYGVDVARDGRHFEIDADVERAIGQ